ncbi:hypothetical protein CFOL_v3_28150 [Cephalotus follicularis]|uniref:Uncharacterized protein n=1 Tax=Cephalotus follicularis TaxID=3775 RepID=A0A1Q3CXA4_CEPFO|nr:hypothetical protein CFOL_v3_28150 [Cephalotus follicularis]
MKRILIDSGSSADILYKHAFDQLKIQTDQLRPVKTPLVGFVGEMVHPLGSIDLSVVTGTAPRQTQVQMTFLVVDTPSPYNVIIGRPVLNLMEVIVSTRHLLMKFPTRFVVGEARGDQHVVRQCYKTAIMDKGKENVLPITNVELIGDVEPEPPQPVEDVIQVPLEVVMHLQVQSLVQHAEQAQFASKLHMIGQILFGPKGSLLFSLFTHYLSTSSLYFKVKPNSLALGPRDCCFSVQLVYHDCLGKPNCLVP